MTQLHIILVGLFEYILDKYRLTGKFGYQVYSTSWVYRISGAWNGCCQAIISYSINMAPGIQTQSEVDAQVKQEMQKSSCR